MANDNYIPYGYGGYQDPEDVEDPPDDIDDLPAPDREGQARAWEEVYDLCRSLGMEVVSQGLDTGIEKVRGVIKRSCASTEASRTAIEQQCDMLLYWLLRAYHARHRQGWEEGPSETETFDSICDVLANLEYDAANNTERVKEMLSRKPVFYVEASVRAGAEEDGGR